MHHANLIMCVHKMFVAKVRNINKYMTTLRIVEIRQIILTGWHLVEQGITDVVMQEKESL